MNALSSHGMFYQCGLMNQTTVVHAVCTRADKPQLQLPVSCERLSPNWEKKSLAYEKFGPKFLFNHFESGFPAVSKSQKFFKELTSKKSLSFLTDFAVDTLTMKRCLEENGNACLINLYARIIIKLFSENNPLISQPTEDLFMNMGMYNCYSRNWQQCFESIGIVAAIRVVRRILWFLS